MTQLEHAHLRFTKKRGDFMKLYPHQIEALDSIKDKNRCAIYYDMGLG